MEESVMSNLRQRMIQDLPKGIALREDPQLLTQNDPGLYRSYS